LKKNKTKIKARDKCCELAVTRIEQKYRVRKLCNEIDVKFPRIPEKINNGKNCSVLK
jgi:hypothetical protein